MMPELNDDFFEDLGRIRHEMILLSIDETLRYILYGGAIIGGSIIALLITITIKIGLIAL